MHTDQVVFAQAAHHVLRSVYAISDVNLHTTTKHSRWRLCEFNRISAECISVLVRVGSVVCVGTIAQRGAREREVLQIAHAARANNCSAPHAHSIIMSFKVCAHAAETCLSDGTFSISTRTRTRENTRNTLTEISLNASRRFGMREVRLRWRVDGRRSDQTRFLCAAPFRYSNTRAGGGRTLASGHRLRSRRRRRRRRTGFCTTHQVHPMPTTTARFRFQLSSLSCAEKFLCMLHAITSGVPDTQAHGYMPHALALAVEIR